MTDALGYRAVFSVVLPATNVIAEPEMAAFRIPGVSNQTYRFPFPGRPRNLDDLINLIGPAITLALDCRPDRLIIGFSSEFLPNGYEIAAQLRNYVEDTGKRPTTMASDAVPEALRVLGSKRIGIVTPYPPETNENVSSYFRKLGFDVINITGIARTASGRIDTGQIREAEIREAVAEVDGADIDTLAQVGTAMLCSGFSADLEEKHRKPVVTVNAATYWLALRQHGFSDTLEDHGILLKDY